MYKNLTITTLLGVFAVILGAFGAHALKAKLSPEAMNGFETAVRYQLFHVIVLLIVNLNSILLDKQKRILTLFFVTGILCFSGSIYAIYLMNIPAKTIWFITPLGGLLLILGWVFLCYIFYKKALVKQNMDKK